MYGISDTSLCLRALCRSFDEAGSWRKTTASRVRARAEANGSPNPLETRPMEALAEPGRPAGAGHKVGAASQLKAQTRSAFVATRRR